MMAGILQEQQLVATEAMNEQLKQILENQHMLAKQNEELRKDNKALADELKEVKNLGTSSRRRPSKSRKDVMVPRDLAVSWNYDFNNIHPFDFVYFHKLKHDH